MLFFWVRESFGGGSSGVLCRGDIWLGCVSPNCMQLGALAAERVTFSLGKAASVQSTVVLVAKAAVAGAGEWFLGGAIGSALSAIKIRASGDMSFRTSHSPSRSRSQLA